MRAYGLIASVILALGLLAAILALVAPPERSWQLAMNSARLAAATCLLSVPLGTVLACAIARCELPGRGLALALLAWLLFVPLFLQVGAWQAGFGLQGWQTLLGWGPAWLVGWRGAVWVHAAAAIPWVTCFVGLGLRTIRPELEEAALLDASPATVFCRVTLRHAAPLMVAATLWVAVAVTGEIAVTDLFQIRTYAEELYTEVAIGAEPGEAPLRVLPGMVVTAWMALAATIAVLGLAPGETRVPQRAPVVFSLGVWRWPVAAALAVALLLLAGLPLANLAWKSGVMVIETADGRARHWSASKCVAVVANSPWRYRRELAASAAIGTVAASAALVLGGWLAWFARANKLGQAVLVTVVVICLAVPGPAVGLGIIALLNQPSQPWMLFLYDRTIVPPALAQLIRALPLACLMLWYALASLPRDMWDAAEIDSAGAWTQFLRLALAQRYGAFAAAWLVSFAVAVGDMGATILVVPPGIEPLSVRISGLLHYGVEDQVAGICLAMALAFLGVGVPLAVLVRGWLEARRG